MFERITDIEADQRTPLQQAQVSSENSERFGNEGTRNRPGFGVPGTADLRFVSRLSHASRRP